MAKAAKLSPMMEQYHRIKREIPSDALLFFRLGDFYEMFFDDAKESASILNVALTKRGETPMCGIPYHAATSYIARLLKAGKKIAICDQVEEAQAGKLVKRGITQILSPGTHFDDRILNAEKNNYLASIFPSGKALGLALVDLTTGSFQTTELSNDQELTAELERLRPAEIIVPEETSKASLPLAFAATPTNACEAWIFNPETAVFTLQDHFKVKSLDGFGLQNHKAAIGAAGAALYYLTQTLRRDVTHLKQLRFYQSQDYLILDSTTLRNLEVIESNSSANRASSLYSVVNRTVTPMGARRLRDWLTQPLSTVEAIESRQVAIKALLHSPVSLEKLRQALKHVRDLERTISRLSIGSGNARDLLILKAGLEQTPELKSMVASIATTYAQHAHSLLDDGVSTVELSRLLDQLRESVAELPDLVQLLTSALIEEPPLTLKEGGMIRRGFDANLDELLSAASKGKDWIAKLQTEEIEKTDIPSLKVKFNSVFGYFIEVTKANLDKVPPNYVRKQTIANGERYITSELKDVEGKILGAEEKSQKLEYEIFLSLREKVITHIDAIQRTADALAQFDVLTSFADLAQVYNYVCPEVADDGLLQIEEGRHPVIEQIQSDEPFVPNDASLNLQDGQVGLITGPNMAGKSTYIRQVALIALLAHTGSFVPAQTCRLDLLDRIFTRIGASDDLTRGQSTFMVEMSETANILNNATRKSLIILDEIGRGTSTFDGLSLAWSIVEHIHNQIGAKTYFATHYHELAELADRLVRVKNFNVVVREWNDEIVFLRKIVEGGTDKSYGIQVARLAGVPITVVERAKDILRNLEESELSPEGKAKSKPRHKAERKTLQELPEAPQMDLFLDA